MNTDMDLGLIEELRQEEHSILEQLRATAPFQRLMVLREVLSLYDAPPVGSLLDAMMPDAQRPPGLASAGNASVIALPGPRAGYA